MKKKLKDLTLGEIVNTCMKDESDCLHCPLRIKIGSYTMCIHFYRPDELSGELDKEIEV